MKRKQKTKKVSSNTPVHLLLFLVIAGLSVYIIGSTMLPVENVPVVKGITTENTKTVSGFSWQSLFASLTSFFSNQSGAAGKNTGYEDEASGVGGFFSRFLYQHTPTGTPSPTPDDISVTPSSSVTSSPSTGTATPTSHTKLSGTPSKTPSPTIKSSWYPTTTTGAT
jgi:hypothetical protein